MAVSHYQWIRTNQDVYKNLTKAWSKGVAIFFATGAVSGTVLSFELGLLWPTFMRHAGPIFGIPFSLEGTAFFIEAIALGFFLYGWDRFNKWFHWITGVVVGLSGLASGILVVSANAWMNSPDGFDFVNGQYLNIDPIDAMFNDAWFSQALHMTLAAFASTGFAVAGVHAAMILQKKNVLFHSKAFKIAAIFAAVAAILQPISGDFSAKDVARRQPAKLAAMEAHFHTQKSAPLIIGGIPDVKNKKVDFAIELPGMLSFLAHGDFESEVKGLDTVPRRPASARFSCPLCFSDHGGLWRCYVAYIHNIFCGNGQEKLVLFVVVVQALCVSPSVRIYRGRGGMDGNGSRAAALDNTGRYANGRCCYAHARDRMVVLLVHSGVYFVKYGRNLSAAPADQNGSRSV